MIDNKFKWNLKECNKLIAIVMSYFTLQEKGWKGNIYVIIYILLAGISFEYMMKANVHISKPSTKKDKKATENKRRMTKTIFSTIITSNLNFPHLIFTGCQKFFRFLIS